MFPLLIHWSMIESKHMLFILQNYPFSKRVAGCQRFSCLFFLSVLYKIFKQPSASSLGVLESYFFVFLAVFFLLNSSSTGRTQFCCYAFFWLIKQLHVAHAQIQPAFWLPSNKCIIPWILMIITRPCLVTVTRALQALVQLLAQTRDNPQYP